MEIKAKISFSDYWQFYKKNYLLRYASIALLILVPALFYTEHLFHDDYEPQDLWIYLLVLVLCVVFIYFRIYFRTKKNFLSNSRIQENHLYTFSPENIRIQGETFETIFEWSSLYKIREVKNWFLLYQSAYHLNLVPKKDLDEDQLQLLRQEIKNSGVPSVLLDHHKK